MQTFQNRLDEVIERLDGVCVWIDSGRKERRTFYAVGDGHFIVDGDILDSRKLMASKLPP